MKTTDSGRPQKIVELSREEEEVWCRAIGRLFICFSPIEMQSHRWIGLLFGAADRRKMARSRLARRIERIVKELERLGGHEEAVVLWKQAEIEARFRNEVAHSPIGFITVDGRRLGRLVDVAKIEDVHSEVSSLLAPEDIHLISDRAVELFQKLSLAITTLRKGE